MVTSSPETGLLSESKSVTVIRVDVIPSVGIPDLGCAVMVEFEKTELPPPPEVEELLNKPHPGSRSTPATKVRIRFFIIVCVSIARSIPQGLNVLSI